MLLVSRQGGGTRGAVDTGILATIIGLVGTGFVTVLSICINRFFDRLKELQDQVTQIHERQAVFRHLLTQAVLRIEALENREREQWKQGRR